MEASEAVEKQRKAHAVPADQVAPKSGPDEVDAGMPKSRLHSMFSYGDPMVYGVAVPATDCSSSPGSVSTCVGQ